MEHGMTVEQSDENSDAGQDSGTNQSVVERKEGKPAFNKSIVNDVPVNLDAYIGSASMTVSELMALENGAVIKLESTLNHIAEIRLNNCMIARGEIVAVDDHFGIRVTEIADEAATE